MTPRIPFEEMGIPSEIGEHTFDVIQGLLREQPNSSIDIQTVSEETGFFGPVVKKVFYALLAFRKLKATFQPRHKACGNIVGLQERSAETVRQKAIQGEYICDHCFQRIDSPDDIEIQIVFWRPGADVDV